MEFNIPDNLKYDESWGEKKDASGGIVGGVKTLFSDLISNADALAESNVGKMAAGYFVNRENNRTAEKIAENKNRYQAHSSVEAKGNLISEAGSQQVYSMNYEKLIPPVLIIAAIPIVFMMIKRLK